MCKDKRGKTLIKLIIESIVMLSSFVIILINKNKNNTFIASNNLWFVYIPLIVSFIFFLYSLVVNVILKKNIKIIDDIEDIISVIPYAILIVLILNTFVLFEANVEGSSMEETFSSSDEVLVSKIYSIERGDVLIFDSGSNYLLIKRVVGLPGDTLTVLSDGTVIINGEVISDVKVSYSVKTYDNYVLSNDEYYFLGDNRAHSTDSRSIKYGVINKEMIVGEVILKLNPLSFDF